VIALAARLKAPVLGLYGGKDDGNPLKSVERMRKALEAAGSPGRIEVFPDAPHGFHADYRPTCRARGDRAASTGSSLPTDRCF